MSMLWVAAAVVAVGVLAAGHAEGKKQDHIAKVEEQNAMLSRRNAGAQEDDQRERARRFQGSQLAAIGESGAGLQGSTADLFRESLFSTEMDALNIRYEGEIGGRNHQNAADMARYDGKQVKTNSYLSAAGALFGAGTKSYGNSTKPKSSGSLNG